MPHNSIYFIPHRNIIQVIQITEYTYFSKLSYSCQHGEFDAAILAFQCSVECFKCFAKTILQFFIADGLQHGLVIFVYQNHYTLACLFISALNGAFKNADKESSAGSFPYSFSQVTTYGSVFQTLRTIIFLCIQVNVQYGIFCPVLFFQFFHSQSLKKFLFPLEISSRVEISRLFPKRRGRLRK